MNLSFSELVKSAAELDFEEYEKFLAAVNKKRAGQRPGSLSIKEAELLEKINKGFSPNKWARLRQLDAKMEESTLSGTEHDELTKLTENYERFSVRRIQLIKKLALLRNIDIEEVLQQLGFQHGEV